MITSIKLLTHPNNLVCPDKRKWKKRMEMGHDDMGEHLISTIASNHSTYRWCDDDNDLRHIHFGLQPPLLGNSKRWFRHTRLQQNRGAGRSNTFFILFHFTFDLIPQKLHLLVALKVFLAHNLLFRMKYSLWIVCNWWIQKVKILHVPNSKILQAKRL